MTESRQELRCSLCLVAFDAIPLIFPEASGSIGGAETRAILMARLLSADPQVRVVVVVRDSRPRPIRMLYGFTVITRVDRLFRIRRFVSEHVTVLKAFPCLRIKSWSPGLIWKIPLLFLARLFRRSNSIEDFHWLSKETNCDVYGCLGVSERTAQIFDAVKSQHRRTLLFVASNADLDRSYGTLPGFVGPHGDSGIRCADAIRSANVIVCQNDVQQKMLKEHFGRDSHCFPNPFDPDDWRKKLQRPVALDAAIPSRFVLWVGRSDRHHKRPDLLLQVARSCSEVLFVMIMNTHDESVATAIRNQRPSNVTIIERVAFDDMPSYFRQSAMFVSTGSKEYEGFPNVFLQAAATAVPILSLEADPGFITKHQAGVVCHGDVEQLASEVKSLWADISRAKRLGENGQQYLSRCHSAAEARAKLLEILEDALR